MLCALLLALSAWKRLSGAPAPLRVVGDEPSRRRGRRERERQPASAAAGSQPGQRGLRRLPGAARGAVEPPLGRARGARRPLAGLRSADHPHVDRHRGLTVAAAAWPGRVGSTTPGLTCCAAPAGPGARPEWSSHRRALRADGAAGRQAAHRHRPCPLVATVRRRHGVAASRQVAQGARLSARRDGARGWERSLRADKRLTGTGLSARSDGARGPRRRHEQTSAQRRRLVRR